MELKTIVNFLSEELGVDSDRIEGDTDIYKEFGIEGDDCFELEEAFSEKFGVNMEGFLWYFHHGEESMLNIGALIFKPPYKRVNRIAITPNLLHESA